MSGGSSHERREENGQGLPPLAAYQKMENNMTKTPVFASMAEKRRYEMGTSMVADAVGEMLCEKLAQLLRRTSEIWTKESISLDAAAAQACTDVPKLAPIVTILTLPQYFHATTTKMWCDQILSKEEQK